MPFIQAETVRYFVFNSFLDARVSHGAITRQGGLSPDPWSSLNVGGTVGDDPSRVLENRCRVFQALDRSLESMYDVWQVHGSNVVCVKAPRLPHISHIKADVMVTDQPGVTLFMRFADCVPIFLYDPVRKVVGLVHAGWQGTVKMAAKSAIEAMKEQYGCQTTDILAGIGPSVGPHHYPVGSDVISAFRNVFGDDSTGLLLAENDGNQPNTCLDLWSANRLILENCGISQIEICGLCTACNLDDWYSHRAENGRTGRFGALIAL